MELAALFLLVPIGWMALSWRSARRARRSRMPLVAIAAGVVLIGWVALNAMAPAPEPVTNYADGDKALRLLLE